MKKLLALLVLVFTCQMAFCQTYDELINKFKDKPEAEAVEVPKLMLNLAVAEALAGMFTPIARTATIMNIEHRCFILR